MADDPTLDDWLQARHHRWHTPGNVINEQVRTATGSAVAHAARLVLGLDNEVYDVTTAADDRLIVRISHKANHRFEGERWALDAARHAGVPTPQVLLVEQAAYDDTTVVFCIEEKLPGKPLDVLLQEGSHDGLDRAIDQIGELLGRLHSVPVHDFGYLDPNGRGQQASWTEIMLMANERQAELYAAARKWDVSTKAITAGLAVLQAQRDLYQGQPPVLVHGDFGPKHVLVDGDHISGFIDMQDCSGNHPVMDFVVWDAYWSDQIPTSRIVASYDNRQLFTGSYDTIFHLALLREAFIMLMVHAARESPSGIQQLIAVMNRALQYFGS